MRTIWKIPLTLERSQRIQVPVKVSEALTVQLQNGRPVLWVVVNNERHEAAIIHIWCLPTGGEGPAPEWDYISTVQLPNGTVWHFFK